MTAYQTKPNKDPYANLIMQAFITNASIGAFVNMVYLKPEASPAAFSPFYSIPTVTDTTKLQTLTEMISGQLVPTIPRYEAFYLSFKKGTSRADLFQIRLVHHHFQAHCATLLANQPDPENSPRGADLEILNSGIPSSSTATNLRQRRSRG